MSGKPSIYKGLRKWGYFLFEKDMLYFDMRNEEIRTGEKMGQFTIYREDVPGVTLLSNSFIDNYMKDANDAQLKIYLYLLRRLGSGQATSVSEIADFFNHTEREVLRSLKYWEKLKLLAIEYDESKNVSGIRFLKGTDEPVTVAAPAVASAPVVAAAPAVVSATAITEKAEEAPAEKADPYKKPSYSADQLSAFKNKENIRQLFFIAESYMGRQLSVSDMKSILYLSDCLHFSDDLIDYLLQYCVDRGKKDFKYIEAVALNWAQSGVTTPKQAEKFAAKYDKSVYTIMKELGKNNTPTKKELEYIIRWTKEYGFSQDIIAIACERTVLATDSHRFEYAEGILSNWKKEDVHHKSDIQRIDAQYQKSRQSRSTSSAASSSQVSSNRFNQFAQRSYEFDTLEARLLGNK